MHLRSLTGENFPITMQMPQMLWHGFLVLYDFKLSEERRAAMLNLIEDYVRSSNEGRVPPIQRIELHDSPDSAFKGYVVMVLEKMTKVFEYETEDRSWQKDTP
jgi:hypothetical protein